MAAEGVGREGRGKKKVESGLYLVGILSGGGGPQAIRRKGGKRKRGREKDNLQLKESLITNRSESLPLF